MAILFTCPSCRKQLSVPEEYGGQQGVCPSCGSPVAVPMASTGGATTAPLQPSPVPPSAAAPAPPVPPVEPQQQAIGRPLYATASTVAPAPPTHQLAIWSLVLGIVSFVMCGPLTAIPGLILGVVARRQIRESSGAFGGEALALVGIILSAVNLAVSIIGLAVWLLLLVSVESF